MTNLVRDYNGTGPWSSASILERYSDYAARLSVQDLKDLSPKEYIRGEQRWIYPAMEKVIEGIKLGDLACATIGVEFIEQDGKFVFGRILKAQTARALKAVELPSSLVIRLRKRIVTMLIEGNIPREYKEYVRLLRKIGFSDLWSRIEASVPRENKYVMRHYGYLRAIHEKSPSVIRVVP